MDSLPLSVRIGGTGALRMRNTSSHEHACTDTHGDGCGMAAMSLDACSARCLRPASNGSTARTGSVQPRVPVHLFSSSRCAVCPPPPFVMDAAPCAEE